MLSSVVSAYVNIITVFAIKGLTKLFASEKTTDCQPAYSN